MTDPTPAEALKAEDIAARALFDFDVATERRIGRERNRKWETELPEYRDHMRAKASAMLAALPSPATDAGEVRESFDGHQMHAMHKTITQDPEGRAKEILAVAMEPHFPVEAEMARKGLHFMLPSSWAVEAIAAHLLVTLPVDAGEPRKAPQWADDRDPMGDLAIKLAARASALEGRDGEWTWREIAECAAEALGAGEVRTGEAVDREMPADDEIRLLREALTIYGDRVRMATSCRPDLQQVIDIAFEATAPARLKDAAAIRGLAR